MKTCIQLLTITMLLIGFDLHASPDAKTERWAKGVVLGPEFGGSGKTVSLWTKSPSISIMGEASQQNVSIVEECIKEINGAIHGTSISNIKLVEKDDSDADILVYFTKLRDFPKVAKKHNFKYTKGNLGYFWTFWNASNEITKAIVLISSDQLEGKLLKHYTLEEITQSLGLSNDSNEFKDSIFYANPSNTTQLSKSDKLLLKFAYTHLKPGMNQREVEKALKNF